MPDPETRGTDAASQASQAAEAAAIRRRWITLGEILAVIAVLISGLTLWNSYQERSSSEAERAAEKKQQAAKSQALVLRGDGGRKKMVLTAVDSGHAVQSQTILFPSALGVDPVEDLVEPRIEAGWIKEAAAKARKAGGGDRDAEDRRMPVLITSRFVSGGQTYSDSAIYDVGYRREGNLLGGSEIDLLGISLVERVKPATGRARLDSLWKARTR
jgi:hypothetical protein